ncbi:MAG: transporter substrate-binding domain-containing protein, partial [Burkholderiaceae bacterium]|nr:transporter substrate-binding domain-containing protein [Burkholderiaceae bacterium]
IDRPGVRVAVPATSFIAPVMAGWLRQAQSVPLQMEQNYELELESGRVDVFMVDFPFSQYLLANTDWIRRLSPPKPLAAMPYAYAVKPGDEAWLQRLNQFVSAIKRDGRLAAAAGKNGLTEIMVRH